jgi:hypothetical protein
MTADAAMAAGGGGEGEGKLEAAQEFIKEVLTPGEHVSVNEFTWNSAYDRAFFPDERAAFRTLEPVTAVGDPALCGGHQLPLAAITAWQGLLIFCFCCLRHPMMRSRFGIAETQ